MRDEMDARLWAAHHEAFSASVESGARALTRRFQDLLLTRHAAGQLLATLLATSLTVITLGATIA